jgi:putative transcriptional regulator
VAAAAPVIFGIRVRMNLQHHFLIAKPSLQDPLFKRSVVYICEHNEDGAMGLIVNKPMDNLTVEGILKKLKISPSERDPAIKLDKPVFAGGPLAEDRGFILHSAQKIYSSSIRISDNTVITTSRDVLEAIGTSEQPDNVLVALGYCAWEKDQLENELLENAWLTTPANSNILFQTPIAERWREAARSMGIDIHNMTSDAGHA